MGPDDTLAATAKRFHQHVDGPKYSVAVVTDTGEQVVGIISLSDITFALGEHGGQAAEMKVSEVMSTDVAVAHPDDEIENLLKTMAQRSIRHMPVIDDGRLAGMVVLRDALEFLADNEALEMEQLRAFVFRSGAR